VPRAGNGPARMERLARIEGRVLDEAPAERARAGDLHDLVDLDLDRAVGAGELGNVLAGPENARAPGELARRARLEVDEEPPAATPARRGGVSRSGTRAWMYFGQLPKTSRVRISIASSRTSSTWPLTRRRRRRSRSSTRTPSARSRASTP